MLFFWTFYLTKNSENVSWLSHKYETAVFNIDNNQHIRMISERSCDTEDWIQHCITGINYILQYIQIEHRFLNCNTFSQYTVFTVFLIK